MKSVDTLRAELLAMPATATFEQRRAALEKIKTHCVWDSEGRMMTISCIFGEVALSI